MRTEMEYRADSARSIYMLQARPDDRNQDRPLTPRVKISVTVRNSRKATGRSWIRRGYEYEGGFNVEQGNAKTRNGNGTRPSALGVRTAVAELPGGRGLVHHHGEARAAKRGL